MEKTITSEAVERLREELRTRIAGSLITLERADVAEAIGDYDALSESYMRIVRGLSETQ